MLEFVFKIKEEIASNKTGTAFLNSISITVI